MDAPPPPPPTPPRVPTVSPRLLPASSQVDSGYRDLYPVEDGFSERDALLARHEHPPVRALRGDAHVDRRVHQRDGRVARPRVGCRPSPRRLTRRRRPPTPHPTRGYQIRMEAYHRDRKKHIALLLNSGADDADDRAAAARARLPILTEADR